MDKENSDEVELTTALIKRLILPSTSCTRMVPTVGSMALEIHTIFTPHGFELLAPLSEKAGQIADSFLEGVANGKRYRNDDDRMTSHYAYDFLQAWEDRVPDRPKPISVSKDTPETIWLCDCNLIISRNGKEWEENGKGRYVVVNLSKGGVLKVFDAQGSYCIRYWTNWGVDQR